MLVDAFRHLVHQGGYTWTRQDTASRLDMVFISSHIKNKIENVKTNRMLEQSYHVAVKIMINIKGKSIDHAESLVHKFNFEMGKTELLRWIEQIPENWGTVMRLEFVKVAIISILEELNIKPKNSDRLHKKGLQNELARV